MTTIKVIGKTELIEKKIEFIACPSLVIPVLEKSYYPKFSWFTSIDALIEEVKKRKPLIILDTPDGKIVNDDKIPSNMKLHSEIFCIRMWDSLPERDWSVIRNNICEPENHNFTFKWDITNCSDPIILAAQKRRETDEQNAREYDKKEMAENAAFVKVNGKRHPFINT